MTPPTTADYANAVAHPETRVRIHIANLNYYATEPELEAHLAKYDVYVPMTNCDRY